MVKIGFPRDFSQLKALFPEKEKERDLYIVAEDTDTEKILGAIRFFYKGNQVDIYETVMTYQGEQYMAVFDGIVRTLLYKLAEDGCTSVAIHGAENEYRQYFSDHEFTEASGCLNHPDFPAEFFKPCAGCSGK